MCLRLVLFDNGSEQGWQRKRLPLIKEVMGPNIGRFGISLSWMRFEKMRRRLPRLLRDSVLYHSLLGSANPITRFRVTRPRRQSSAKCLAIPPVDGDVDRVAGA